MDHQTHLNVYKTNPLTDVAALEERYQGVSSPNPASVTRPEDVLQRRPEPPMGPLWFRWTDGLSMENPPGRKQRHMRTSRRGKTSRLAAASSEDQEEAPAARSEPQRINRSQNSAARGSRYGTAVVQRPSRPGTVRLSRHGYRHDLDHQRRIRDGGYFSPPLSHHTTTIPTSLDMTLTLSPFLDANHNPYFVNTGLHFWPTFAFPLLYTTRLARLDDADSAATATATPPFQWPPAPGSLLMSVLLLFGSAVEAGFSRQQPPDAHALQWHGGQRIGAGVATMTGGGKTGSAAVAGIKAMLCRQISDNLSGVTVYMRRFGLRPGKAGVEDVSAWPMLVAVFSLGLASLMTGIDDDWEVHMQGLSSMLSVVGGMSALGRASPKVLSEFRMLDIEGSIVTGKAPIFIFSRVYAPLDLQLPIYQSSTPGSDDLETVQAQLRGSGVHVDTTRTIRTSYALIEALRQANGPSSSSAAYAAKCKPEELMEEFASIQYELMCHPDPLFFCQQVWEEGDEDGVEPSLAATLGALHKSVRIGALLYLRQVMIETPYAKRSYVRLLTELIGHLHTILHHYRRESLTMKTHQEQITTPPSEEPALQHDGGGSSVVQQSIRQACLPVLAWLCVLVYYFSARYGADLPLSSREATVHWDIVREVLADPLDEVPGLKGHAQNQHAHNRSPDEQQTNEKINLVPQKDLAMCRLLNLKFIAGGGWDGEKMLGIMLQWR